MLHYYLDDCEFGGSFQHTILNGGIIVHEKEQLDLITAIEDYKEAFCGKRYIPIKYNLKDLKVYYAKNEISDTYEVLMKDYNGFRRGLIDELLKFDIKILCACMKTFFPQKKFIVSSKDKLRRYVFVMCLMRFALEARDSRSTKNTVFFDYPDSRNPEPFNIEYLYAYRKGVSKDGNDYSSGKLSNNGFVDSVNYSYSKSSALIQVADIVVGAIKQFIEYSLNNEKPRFGYELVSQFLPNFRGYPSKIPKYGLVTDNGDGTREIKIAVNRTIKELIEKNK